MPTAPPACHTCCEKEVRCPPVPRATCRRATPASSTFCAVDIPVHTHRVDAHSTTQGSHSPFRPPPSGAAPLRPPAAVTAAPAATPAAQACAAEVPHGCATAGWRRTSAAAPFGPRPCQLKAGAAPDPPSPSTNCRPMRTRQHCAPASPHRTCLHSPPPPPSPPPPLTTARAPERKLRPHTHTLPRATSAVGQRVPIVAGANANTPTQTNWTSTPCPLTTPRRALPSPHTFAAAGCGGGPALYTEPAGGDWRGRGCKCPRPRAGS